MKYEFKTDLVLRDLEHSIRRYIEEAHPKCIPCVDITSDPRSIVCAYLIKKIFPGSAHAFYVEDTERNKIDEDTGKMIEKLYKDNFIKITEDECKYYRDFLDMIHSDVYTEEAKLHLGVKHAYLHGYHRDKSIMIFDYHDTFQVRCGITSTLSVPTFADLNYQEILLIADKLNIKREILNYAYGESEDLKRLEKELEIDIGKADFGDDDTEEYYNTVDMITLRYIDAVINPINIQVQSMYDIYSN